MSRALLSPNQEAVAANGLLDRRLFLRGGAGAALAIGGIVAPNVAASREPLRGEPWMKVQVRRSSVTANPRVSRTRSCAWQPIRPMRREPAPPARRCIG